MGFVKVKKKVTKPCFHYGEYGEYCAKCGARKVNGFFQSGSITEYEDVLEPCFHYGEIGKYCSKCGDKIGFDI